MNKRKVIIGIVVTILIFIAIGITFFQKSLDINEIMEEYLIQLGINNYKVSQVSDYRNIKYFGRERGVSQKDIKNYIDEDLEAREEHVEILDRDYVKKGDIVLVSYAVYMNGKQVNYVENDSFMVGKGKYNSQIEKNIIGRKRNQKIVFNIQVPEDDENEDFAGKTETVELYVKSINIVKSYKLDMDFVSKFYKLNTLEEYYDYVKKELKLKNDVESDSIEKKEIYSKLIKCFRYELSEKEIAKYSLNIINEYREIAYIYGKSLDEYREENLKKTQNEFMDMCYNEGEERIKQYIAVGAIAKLENLVVNKGDNRIEETADKLIDKTLRFLKEKKYLKKGNIK